MWNRIETNGIGYWQESAFENMGVLQAFSECGADKAFDLALHTGNDVALVCANRAEFAEVLGIHMEDMVTMQQVHGTHIASVTSVDCGKGMWDYADCLPETDALITNQVNVALFGCFADCVPIFFADAKTGTVALAHGGWKGTVGEITKRTIAEMQARYGVDPADIAVAIGPSIGPDDYEVGANVIEQVQALSYGAQVLRMVGADRAYLNLWEMHRLQCIEAGAAESHISVCGISTASHTERFFSYRAQNGKTGRMGAVIMRKRVEA